MDHCIEFENSLYGINPSYSMMDIYDIDFWVNRLVGLPALRPFSIEKVVQLCITYCENHDFGQLMLEKGITKCITLIHRLYKSGIYDINDILPYLYEGDSYIICYYFRGEICNFNQFISEKWKPYNFDDSFISNEAEIDDLLEYGFSPGTIEYCLKFDDISTFRSFLPLKAENIRWSPFEWAKRPDSIDLMSFSGCFGSINCFKHLLLNGYNIKHDVMLHVVQGGNLDMFRLSYKEYSDSEEFMIKSIEYCHLHLLRFLFEERFNILESNRDEIIHIKNVNLLNMAVTHGHLSIIDYLQNQEIIVNNDDSDIIFNFLIHLCIERL